MDPSMMVVIFDVMIVICCFFDLLCPVVCLHPILFIPNGWETNEKEEKNSAPSVLRGTDRSDVGLRVDGVEFPILWFEKWRVPKQMSDRRSFHERSREWIRKSDLQNDSMPLFAINFLLCWENPTCANTTSE